MSATVTLPPLNASGRLRGRSDAFLITQWIDAIGVRLNAKEDADKTRGFVESILQNKEPVRKALGGLCREWRVDIKAAETLGPTLLGLQNITNAYPILMPSEAFYTRLLTKLAAGSGSPTVQALLDEYIAAHPKPSEEPLARLPVWIIENRIGKNTFVALAEKHGGFDKIPTCLEEILDVIRLSEILNATTNTIQPMTKALAELHKELNDADGKPNPDHHLYLTITGEPHQFIRLGNIKSVDIGSCFGPTGGNGGHTILLAQQPTAIVAYLSVGPSRVGLGKRKIVARAWGRISPNGYVVLTNFYPKGAGFRMPFMALFLSALGYTAEDLTPEFLSLIYTPSGSDNHTYAHLWPDAKSYLYHNGDMIAFPIPPGTGGDKTPIQAFKSGYDVQWRNPLPKAPKII